MAPMTRRSQTSASNAKRAPTRKHPTRQRSQIKDEWVQEVAPSRNGDFDHMDGDEPHMSIEGPTQSIRDAFNPLREMADKIGKEVERFAITMDGFLEDLSGRNNNRYAAVQMVVTNFKNIAKDSIEERRHGHEKELSQQLREDWTKQAQLSTALGANASKKSVIGKSGTLLGMKAEKVKELRDWQQELDIWKLFEIVLEVHYRPTCDPEGLQKETERQLRALETPHRYSADVHLFERFTLEDSLAKERALIKRWLEQTIDHQQSDLDDVVQELENKVGAGRGMWSQGWMHTRERIKGEKRMRSWPSASDSIQPQIRSSDNNELLITQLDPDAPGKHQRVLEKADALSERAVWIACWEMLRRGKSWEDILDWCTERNEGWRALALGRSGDEPDAFSAAAWRRVCHLASQSPTANEYEAAAFALLSGGVQPVQKIARSIDDHLYAYYNGLLVRQYEQYVQKLFCDKTMSTQLRFLDEVLQDPAQAQEDITRLIKRLRDNPSTSSESAQPLKIVQSYLLANELDALLHTVGVAVAAEDRHTSPEERMIMWLKESENLTTLVETEIALDPRALRITAHISMLLAALRAGDVHEDEVAAEENVMISFIQQLRAAGKRDLIPLYAARLSHGRRTVFLADFLLDIGQPAEQEELLKLMTREYKFPVDDILWEQLTYLLEHITVESGKAIDILERTQGQSQYPGQRIKVDFLPEALTEEDVKIVRSLQWFVLLEGEWEITFKALSTALRKCLVSRRFACALEIIRNFPYETISVHKSYHVLSKSVNLMDESITWPRKAQEAEQWREMQQQSSAYFELAQLVQAIESLSKWVQEERPYVDRSPPPSPLPTAIKEAKRDVDDAMIPLLSEDFLTTSKDQEEMQDFKSIRQAYLPEILIAYNTVLHTAGNIYTRDCLLESMDLSVKIADESNGLAQILVQAGRMKEMVESFAYSSKAILVLKAQSNKPWKSKKDREGKDPSIWDIGPQGRTNASHGVVPA